MELFLIEINPANSCLQELENLIKREEIASLARQKFLSGEITFSDFLDCLEVAEMDVDDFLNINNENCRLLGF